MLAFPPGFLFGASTSATQIEGGCTTIDWDAFAREPGRVRSGDTPRVACDSWNRWRDDVALVKRLGLSAYRMGVEWGRLEPRAGTFDRASFERYREMLGALKDAGIATMVTLHHFSLPPWMAARGGVLSGDLCDRMERYTREAVRALGDLVDYWITINEPTILSMGAYVLGWWPPAKKSPLDAIRAQRHLLDAHVRMYRTIHELLPDAKVGLAHHIRVIEPKRARLGDRLGAWVVREAVNDGFVRAVCEGKTLGPFDARRVADAKGTQDFFGLNYYSRDLVSLSSDAREAFVHRAVAEGAEVSDLGWEIYPEGLGQLLRYWGSRCGVPVVVTENGIADRHDRHRPRFLVRHLAEVARAIQDGVDVRGYFYWSLMDNFEWSEGYAPRFGLAEVDYTTLERKPRKSAELYARIARDRAVNEEMI